MKVHRQLGCGFLEPVYQEALALELASRGIPFREKGVLAVYYKERQLQCTYCPDFICFDSVIVEIKAFSKLSGVEEAQVINYLKATGIETGLLINFGTQYQRFIRSNPHAHNRRSHS
jgi:GxxExxY protein